MNKIEKVQKAIQQALGICDFSGLSSVKIHLLRAINELKKIEEKNFATVEYPVSKLTDQLKPSEEHQKNKKRLMK